MPNWLQRLGSRLVRTSKSEPSGRSAQLCKLFYKRSLYPDSHSFFAALIELFPQGLGLETSELRVLIDELRGSWGPQKALEEGELVEHLEFWRRLVLRTSSPYAMACYGDSLLLAGRDEDAASAVFDALRSDPSLFDELGDDLEELARSLGGDTWLRFRIIALRVRLRGKADQEDDEVREEYSELLEEFSGDTGALQEIRELGAILEDKVQRGAMPRAMVLRGRSRDEN